MKLIDGVNVWECVGMEAFVGIFGGKYRVA